MKVIPKTILIAISILVMGSSCEKNEVTSDIKPCNLSDMLKEVADSKGTVWFNSSTQAYAIYVSTEGSYDSQDIGIVCNLPLKYQVDGLKIIFSGKYFKYSKEVSQKIPGQAYYFLELNRIEMDANR